MMHEVSGGGRRWHNREEGEEGDDNFCNILNNKKWMALMWLDDVVLRLSCHPLTN